MSEILFFLLGGGISSIGTAIILRRKYARALERQAAQQVNYKQSWSEAVNLLAFNGQITEEQLAKIMPPLQVVERRKSRLPRGQGFSADRRDTEIARAKASLPPADNLEGMYSSDIREVHEARIKYGTAE